MSIKWKYVCWFYKSWYQYLFAKFDNPHFCPWYMHLWCRIKGHPRGPIYYSSGMEPDDRCKDCGDYI
jgi:hypothetical protein